MFHFDKFWRDLGLSLDNKITKYLAINQNKFQIKLLFIKFIESIETQNQKSKMGLDLYPFRLKYLEIFERYKIKKPLKIRDLSGFNIICYVFSGLDGTRTRDPLRDRQVF